MASVSHGQYRLFVDDVDEVADGTQKAPAEATAAPVAASTPTAVREVLGFCPRLLSALPLPTTLVCVHRAVGQVVITTAQAVYTRAAQSWPAFTGRELAALALAVEHERASSPVFVQWCARKRESHAWRLDPGEALGAVPGRFDAVGSVTVGQTLAVFGLVLSAVGVGEDELPACQAIDR